MLVFWDTRRNDFWAMLLHHVATVALVALSYYLGCDPLLLTSHDCMAALFPVSLGLQAATAMPALELHTLCRVVKASTV